jgi:arylsulfatase A
VLDGYDLTAVLKGRGRSPRQDVVYYRGPRIYAVRHGAYKAHFFTRSEYGPDPEVAQDPPLLYDLDQDPGERWDVSAKHPDVVAALARIVADHAKTVRPVENQLEKRLASTGP